MTSWMYSVAERQRISELNMEQEKRPSSLNERQEKEKMNRAPETSGN